MASVPATLAQLPQALLEPLPLFFYGTLMSGFRNHLSIVGSEERMSPARLQSPCAALWHFEAGHPGLYEDGGGCGVVLGQLCSPRPEHYLALLEKLDALEEFFGLADPRNVYERVVRDVIVGDGDGQPETMTRAYVYICLIPREGDGSAPCRLCPHGDWRRFMREAGLSDAADDWSATLHRRLAEVEGAKT